MTCRWAAGGLLATLLAAPAGAVELTKPIGSVSVETAYDDHISGRASVDAVAYPFGNADWRGAVAAGLGEDILIDRKWGLYLGGRVKANRFLNYADFNTVQGMGVAELAGYDLGGFDWFLSYSLSADFVQSRTQSVTLAADRPLWGDLVGTLAAGYYRFDATVTDYSNQGTYGDLGTRYSFPFGLTLSAGASALQRSFSARTDTMIGGFLGVSQRLLPGIFLRLNYRYDRSRSSDAARNFGASSFTMGTSYYF